MDKPLTLAIVFHSQSGNTARLAESVRDGVLSLPFHVVTMPVDDIDWDALAAADGIIFGCPTHMGSVSAPFKAFMDASVVPWVKGQWRDKIAGAFTNSACPSGDKLNTLQQIQVFAAQHGMIWIGLDVKADPKGTTGGINRLGSWLGAMAESDPRKADGELPEADLKTAHYLGQRVARATVRWHFGIQ